MKSTKINAYVVTELVLRWTFILSPKLSYFELLVLLWHHFQQLVDRHFTGMTDTGLWCWADYLSM